MRKVISLFIVGLLFFSFFLTGLVCAFGVSSGYSEDRPLNVYPGEVKDAWLTLRARADEGDLIINAILLDDAGIASLIDINLEYFVSLEKPAVVNIRLKIPKDAVIGEEYSVKLKFTDITPSEKLGTVGLKLGSVVFLKPKVVEKPAEEKLAEKIGIVWVLLGILVVLIVIVVVVIWFVIKSRKAMSAEGAKLTTRSISPSKV